MIEGNGPEFQLIRGGILDCTARSCFEDAQFWAMWNRTMAISRSLLLIKRAVCHAHRDAIEGRPWNEVSENFRTDR